MTNQFSPPSGLEKDRLEIKLTKLQVRLENCLNDNPKALRLLGELEKCFNDLITVPNSREIAKAWQDWRLANSS